MSIGCVPPLVTLPVVGSSTVCDGGVDGQSVGEFTLAIGEVKERKGHHLSLPAFLKVAPQYPDLHHFLVGRL